MTPQIQVFTGDGVFVRGWQTPQYDRGKPSGLSFDNAGNLLVCDTHYFRVLVYTPQGELLENQTIGGTCGSGNGEFQFVTDAAQDAAGNYYIAQYFEYDRIQKFTPDRQFVLSWATTGRSRANSIARRKSSSTTRGSSGSRMPATTAYKYSTLAAARQSSSSSGASKGMRRDSSIIPTIFFSTMRHLPAGPTGMSI